MLQADRSDNYPKISGIVFGGIIPEKPELIAGLSLVPIVSVKKGLCYQ